MLAVCMAASFVLGAAYRSVGLPISLLCRVKYLMSLHCVAHFTVSLCWKSYPCLTVLDIISLSHCAECFISMR